MGPAVGLVARKLGKPLMPWQQYVADVILEIDSETGRLAYSEWGLTVPRQSGKSTLVLAKSVHRCSATAFFGSRQRLVYTAQTRAKAREKWEEDYAGDLEASNAFKSRVLVHKGNGNEHIRFTNGSRFGIDANTEKAGHGGTLDEAYIDEAFAQADSRLEQAFGPAMITRANKQLGWISTAGWLDGSPYLEQKVKVGRRAVAEQRSRGLAYFEWSADLDSDPGDPATWWSCMPALGFTITEDAIRAEYEKAVDADKLNDFKRAYLNLWVPKEVPVLDPSVVDLAVWRDLSDPTSKPSEVAAFGIDTTPDRSWSSIGAVGARDDGKAHLELVDHRPGTGWVVDRCVSLNREHGPAPFVMDASSPAASMLADLERAGLDVTVLSDGDLGRACVWMVDAVGNGTVAHGPDELLDAAVEGARKKELGDGLFKFVRRASIADIGPLMAVTVAAHVMPAVLPYDDVSIAFL